jgi:hypothetical protein
MATSIHPLIDSMHLFPAISLATAAFACSVASAQLIEPRTVNQRALVDSVSARLSSCFTTLGPRRSFTIAAVAPPQGELWAAVLLAASGPRVADGYNYMLLMHGRSNAAFVVQIGGFATQPMVYWPLLLETNCRTPAEAG